MNSPLLNLFVKTAKSAKGTKIERLLGNPRKIITAKFLSYFGQLFHKTGMIKGKTFWGDEMSLNYPECVSLLIFRDGYYEEGLTTMMLKYLKSGMIFCDIGAHFGFFTLLGSVIVGNSGQVHSFEPTPSTFRVLQSNVKCKNNVTINNIALFSSRKVLSFNDYGLEYSAFNSLRLGRLDDSVLKKVTPQKIDVNTTTLDEYVESKNIKLDFVKIDAESAEYEILQGMKNILINNKPIISLEVGDFEIANVQGSLTCISYILRHGYQSYECKDGNIVKHDLKKKYSYDNILFLPE